MPDYIVNGYAYPSIAPGTLKWWLPRLTWLSSFSYGFTESGELVNLQDYNLIEPAREAGVKTLMVLTPMDSTGRLNDNIAIEVFNNPEAEENLINNIEANIKEKGVNGVDFDFE